jgi:hypothetical protein
MEVMKREETERYLKLERLSNRIDFDPREAYPSGSGKERVRAELAKEFSGEVTVVAPARLMSLLGQALKFQRSQGLLPDNMTAQVGSAGLIWSPKCVKCVCVVLNVILLFPSGHVLPCLARTSHQIIWQSQSRTL